MRTSSTSMVWKWSCDPPLNAAQSGLSAMLCDRLSSIMQHDILPVARSWSVWARQGPARPPNLHSEPNEFRSSHVICNYWMLWSRDSSLVDFAHPKFRLLEARSCCQSFHFRVQWWGTCTRRATLWMARSDVLSPGVSQLCWRPSSGWTESVRAGHDKGISQGLTWADPLDPAGYIPLLFVAIVGYCWIFRCIFLCDVNCACCCSWKLRSVAKRVADEFGCELGTKVLPRFCDNPSTEPQKKKS